MGRLHADSRPMGEVTGLPRHYRVPLETFHYKWSRSHKPALSVKAGDTVTFEINDVGSWQLNKDSTSEDVLRFDPEKLYPLAGPVFIEEAEPGDALMVEVLDVRVADFGWSYIQPGLVCSRSSRGRFSTSGTRRTRNWPPSRRGSRYLSSRSAGFWGWPRGRRGFTEVAPPGRHGGNMDIRHLSAGSWVKIPVWVDGALFSTGDVHAAMGDAEVCGTAIECAGTATIRFGIEKRAGLTFRSSLLRETEAQEWIPWDDRDRTQT